MTVWTKQQDEAMMAVGRWLAAADKQVFRLFGYAGTGKSTIVKHLASTVDGTVRFATFTGKAASVLRAKGCPDATTIHRLIYTPKSKSEARLNELRAELATLPPPPEADDQRARLLKLIQAETKNLSRPSFSLNPDSDLRKASLLVIDEVSMVDMRMGQDLLSFNVPILVLGDPAQLPPVGGEGFFTGQAPDAMLTEIHRQAADNPIIRLATMARLGTAMPEGIYGGSLVVEGKPDRNAVLVADQILVGKNTTRKWCNKKLRELRGFTDPLPMPGDKLVCLRNNHELGILNGTLWSVLQSSGVDDADDTPLDMLLSDDSGTELAASVWRHCFLNLESTLGFWQRRDAEEFDYGYALTVHKSQGSQWANVVVIDESRCFRGAAKNWLYTAITRASENVIIAR